MEKVNKFWNGIKLFGIIIFIIDLIIVPIFGLFVLIFDISLPNVSSPLLLALLAIILIVPITIYVYIIISKLFPKK